jgi:hypothetical protein
MTTKRPFVYIGSLVSDEDAARHPCFSQAANLYQSKFIDFTRPSGVITLVPIFVTGRWIFRSSRSIKFIYHYVPLPKPLQRLWRWISDTVSACIYIKRTGLRDVFFYNIDKQNLALAVLARFLLRRRIYVIVADYVHYEGRLLRWVVDWSFSTRP